MSLFADDMVLYIEYPKDALKTLLELINEFGEVGGYEIKTQKSVAFLLTTNYEKVELRKQSYLQ